METRLTAKFKTSMEAMFVKYCGTPPSAAALPAVKTSPPSRSATSKAPPIQSDDACRSLRLLHSLPLLRRLRLLPGFSHSSPLGSTWAPQHLKALARKRWRPALEHISTNKASTWKTSTYTPGVRDPHRSCGSHEDDDKQGPPLFATVPSQLGSQIQFSCASLIPVILRMAL